MKQWLKRLLIFAGLWVNIIFLAYGLRHHILTGLGSLLVIDDPLQQADIIFLLNGDVQGRPFHAAKLFKQGLATQIVVAQEEDSPAAKLGLYPNGTDVAVEIMQQLGVPEDNITVIKIKGGVTSTFDEALALRNYVITHDIKQVILVTSAFHTRRTQWIFKKTLADSRVLLEVSASPHYNFDQSNWWRTEPGLIMLTNEYIKLFYYFAIY
jgi:uncharacterized SAM-binding protein YcdF (DUF218 family)